MKKIIWTTWFFITAVIASVYGYEMVASKDKESFLIGETTHGHYQIEMECTVCHADAFGGTEVLQDACTNCHAEELESSHDSHPKKKFTDPRNADRLEIIDARYCVSCHTEHKSEQTHPMGLTLPEDYCYHCHQEISDERESHKDLAFDSCASAGCHNYHDNRALYERFLVENSGGTWLKENPHSPVANYAEQIDFSEHPHFNLSYSEKSKKHPEIYAEWAGSKHAEANIQCGGCHVGENNRWQEKPGMDSCESCHQKETEHFQLGKHGMRLAQGLSPMSPSMGRLEFHGDAIDKTLTCNSCHSTHSYNSIEASVEACTTCHNDQHTNAFETSPHGQLYQQWRAGEIEKNQAVTCASCHMPAMESHDGIYYVEHNQNENLRPNEKMIRPVCLDCHNLEFAIDALADQTLIDNNFNGKPSKHIPSIDWAKQNQSK